MENEVGRIKIDIGKLQEKDNKLSDRMSKLDNHLHKIEKFEQEMQRNLLAMNGARINEMVEFDAK